MTGLWERIAGHAQADPGRVAVLGEWHATYRELADLVEETAARLPADCGPGDVVAIRSTTSLPGLVALLAVARRGAAFLPLDIAAPASWQAELIRNAGARAVIGQRPEDPAGLDVELVEGRAPGAAVPPETAYLIFTSGSTGRPKGVLVSKTALAGRLDGLARVPGLGPDASFLALTALSFDISLAELLLPLRVGGRVVMAPPSARLDPAAFDEVVGLHRPDVIQATPSFWRLVIAADWSGAPDAVLWCGGEALGDRLAGQLAPLCRELWNVYGPTEATVWATAWRIEPGRPVSLGAALPGSTCHLVDADGRIVTDAGQEGEIVLGGAGLALGYLGDPPEQARFTSIPGAEGPVYLTGDRGTYRDDGTLEFLGRKDTQVKLRGHRLELGEVESAIEAHPAVQQAVVYLCDQDDPKRAHLAAVVGSASLVTGRELRRWLAERVPQTMVPKRVTVRPGLPRTSAGKVDRVALRELVAARDTARDSTAGAALTT